MNPTKSHRDVGEKQHFCDFEKTKTTTSNFVKISRDRSQNNREFPVRPQKSVQNFEISVSRKRASAEPEPETDSNPEAGRELQRGVDDGDGGWPRGAPARRQALRGDVRVLRLLSGRPGALDSGNYFGILWKSCLTLFSQVKTWTWNTS